MFEILDRETKLLSLSRGLLAEHDQCILSSEICCHISNSSLFLSYALHSASTTSTIWHADLNFC
jgi:hypothetical protein